MAARARVELAVAALVLAAVVGYAVGDDELVDSVLYVGVMVGASVAAWMGAERAPAEHRLVGRLIATGVSLTALGDAVWELLDAIGPEPEVSLADPAWFASYLALCGALCVVLRRSSNAGSRDDLAFVLDAVTVVAVSVLVFWSVSINAIVADQGLAAHVRMVYAAYPIADAVLLALVVRVLTIRRSRAALDPWFAVGVCLWLAADIMYLQAPTGSTEIVMDAAWMVAPVLMARAAWRVDPVALPAPAAPSHRSRVAQLAIAIGPLIVPPALETVAELRGAPHQHGLLIVGSTILTLLAFMRMALLIRSEERAHHELELARDAALEASRAKSMFLATMSHEIRTPLTMVLGAGEILEDTPLDEMQLELVRRMRRSGGLLRALVDGILDFSRIEAGQLELAPTRFDLHAVLDDLADIYRPRATQAGTRFDCRVYPGAPRTVVGDRDRLLQVLSNLLDNALKFTHEGEVRLVIRPAPAPARGTGADSADRVELVVADTGIGMRQEDLGSVFESFNQLDGSTTRRYGGSGLGLAICKELTELMGGSLTVASELGVGSVFTARIPLPVAEPEGAGARDDLEPVPVAARTVSSASSTTSG